MLDKTACLVLPFLGRAEDGPAPERLEKSARDFALSYIPKLNTNSPSYFRRLEVKGLWEGLKVQVFDLIYNEGGSIRGFVGVYYDGKITSLAPINTRAIQQKL